MRINIIVTSSSNSLVVSCSSLRSLLESAHLLITEVGKAIEGAGLNATSPFGKTKEKAGGVLVQAPREKGEGQSGEGWRASC